MILIDLSSIIHRMIHSSISSIKPKIVDGKYITSDFIGFTKYLIFQDLFNIHLQYSKNFGNITICLDKSENGYWRKDVYPGYKSSRKKGRDKSNINYSEVFSEIDILIKEIDLNLPWKVVSANRAEADDIILVLSREYNHYEKILIHSPDKDMIQAQRNTDNVFQYSALTKKWIVPENKHDNMNHWISEHICLGDNSDEVPKVVDHTVFSENFINHLKNNGIDSKYHDVYEFKNGDLKKQLKHSLLSSFNIYKVNRKGESTDIIDVYKDIKFGPATLQKEIKKYDSIDKWLDSNPLYRQHYERNFTLVMEEGIPEKIWTDIVASYENAKSEYNKSDFEKYLIDSNLKSLLLDLPTIFKNKEKLTIDNCGW